ncbi:rapid alkalinization factor [Oryza brachyantha]|uniref:rapid alkalinization factor n=1 Tax=Oryza brachyantha TaxID=4533 RepID=UPI001ADD5482|nr:rapid alkalinization factor [Oryza brachyantha]
MAASVRFLAVLVVVLAVAAAAASAASLAGGEHHLQLGILSTTGGECRGTVGECLGRGEVDGGEEEGELGSASAEAHRRVLAGNTYISYGALRRDSVPCSRRGASYYNCRPGGAANPYHRGCSRITRCRG